MLNGLRNTASLFLIRGILEKFPVLTLVLVVSIEQRGLAQEVSLVTKRGVEAKNYEGVSILLFLSTLTVVVNIPQHVRFEGLM
jgi:hypothetical protein